MKQLWIRACLLGVLALSLTGHVRAETRVRYEARPESSLVRVEGTSTLHGWTVEGRDIQGYLEIEEGFQTGPVADLPSLRLRGVQPRVRIEIPVLSLNSHKEGMDEKMYEALKEKGHPKIVYRLMEAVLGDNPDLQKFPLQLDTRGELTVAGVSRPVEMRVSVARVGERQLRITGETRLRMTDFGIKPPRAMLGMVRTGDEIQIVFEWMAELAGAAEAFYRAGNP